MSLSVKILIAMFVGAVCGWGLGYALPGVGVVAKAFVLILQMTAIPYIAISLVYGIGLLSKDQAGKLAKYGLLSYLVLVFITCSIILLAPIAFPDWTSASFYSAGIANKDSSVDLYQLFIPFNPFFSLANGMVPAVVVFCTFLGIGFMGIRHRKLSLHLLRDIQNAIGNVSSLIMRAAPFGVFCIAQQAAGTLEPSVLDGLVVYVVMAVMLTVVLSLVVLPGFLVIVTPLSYRQVLNVSSRACITAFATGSLLVVLPIISESIKQLLADYTRENDPAENLPEVVVSISYSLPTAGKFFALLFVIFASWFSGENISVSDYPGLTLISIAYLFGSAFIAVPELLDMYDITAGLFDLYLVADNLIVGKLGSLLGAMFCFVFTLLVSFAVLGKIRIFWKNLWRHTISMSISFVAMLFLVKVGFGSMAHQYQGYDAFIDRQLLYPPAESVVLKAPNIESSDPNLRQLDTLQRIKQRGSIRIGYYRDSLPYSFHNKDGELVGLDVELMHMLARELNVKAEFVLIFHDQTEPLLNSGYLDIAGGMPLIPENMATYTLTSSYSEDVVGVVVKDERRNEFRSWDEFLAREDLIIGVPETLFFHEAIRQNASKPTVWELSTPRIFFRDDKPIDALIYGAAGGSAWSLVYPEYGVVIPKPVVTSVPMAFPIARNDQNFELFMRNWIEMKEINGTLRRLFNFWIEGKTDLKQQR